MRSTLLIKQKRPPQNQFAIDLTLHPSHARLQLDFSSLVLSLLSCIAIFLSLLFSNPYYRHWTPWMMNSVEIDLSFLQLRVYYAPRSAEPDSSDSSWWRISSFTTGWTVEQHPRGFSIIGLIWFAQVTRRPLECRIWKKGFVEGILDSVREGVPQEFATIIKADPNKPVPALIWAWGGALEECLR